MAQRTRDERVEKERSVEERKGKDSKVRKKRRGIKCKKFGGKNEKDRTVKEIKERGEKE